MGSSKATNDEEVIQSGGISDCSLCLVENRIIVATSTTLITKMFPCLLETDVAKRLVAAAGVPQNGNADNYTVAVDHVIGLTSGNIAEVGGVSVRLALVVPVLLGKEKLRFTVSEY